MSGSPDGLGPALARLEPLLMAESLDDALAHGARLAASVDGVEVAAIFLATGQDTGAESWVPGDDETRSRFRPHLRGLALESLARTQPVTTPFPPGPAAGLDPVVVPLVDRGRVLGMLCLAGRPGAGAACAEMAPVVARRLADLQDAAAAQATKTRYERWFRQFDQQVRLLERERQKFAALVNQTDTYVFVTDRAGVIRWVSRGMAARFAAGAGSGWVGRPCAEVWERLGRPAGAAQGPMCPVSRAQAAARTERQEFRLEEDGSARDFCVTAIPVLDPDGRAQEVLVVAQDLSGLETLRRAEQGLHSVVSSAPVVLFVVDREGVFTLSEGRGLAALGLAPGQVVGRSAFEFYGDQPVIVDSLRRSLAGEEFTTLVEVGGLAFETRFTPRRDGEGRVTGVIGVATDVTERRRLEDRLRQSKQQEAVAFLAAEAAHEFSDLLVVIMGNNQLVLGRVQPGHPLRQSAEEVQRACARGALLVQRLLALTRAEGVAPGDDEAARPEAA